MGYETCFTGEIYYGDVISEKQKVIERICEMIETVSWHCSGSYGNGLSINYYTNNTEWIHFIHFTLDKEKKVIDLSGWRKDYHNATETFLSFISRYLNYDTTYLLTMCSEYEDDVEQEILIKNNNVTVDGERFETNNTLSFPFPTFSLR